MPQTTPRDPLLPAGKKETPQEPNAALKIAVLIGLIILLIIGVLLPIRLIPRASTSAREFFSSLFSRAPRATISVNKEEIKTGESFTLSWTGEVEDGSYVLNYECRPGLRLETSIVEPNQRITCGESYYFAPDENFIILTAFSEATRESDINLTFGFLPDGSSNIRNMGEATVTVINEAIADVAPIATTTPVQPRPTQPATTTAPVRPATTTRPTTTQTRPVSTIRPSNPNGVADLKITILSTGYLNRATGAYTPAAYVTRDMAAAVRFMVTNNGDKNTGTWSFAASLPSKTNPTYATHSLANLAPGQSTIFTLGFEGIQPGSGIVNITLDALQHIPETNEINNGAAVQIVAY